MRFVVPAVLVSLVLGGCSLFSPHSEQRELAEQFAAAAEQHSLEGVPVTDTDEFDAALGDLSGVPVKVTVGDIDVDDDTATAQLEWEWQLGAEPWRNETTLRMVKHDGEWIADPIASVIDNSLLPGERVTVTRTHAKRANILGADGKVLVTERPVVRIGLDKANLDGSQWVDSATQLANAVGITVDAYVTRVENAGAKAFVEAIVLRAEDAEKVVADVMPIEGSMRISAKLPLAPTRTFAAAILGRVGEATAEIVEDSEGRIVAGDQVGLSGLQRQYDEQLAGTPGVLVKAGERTLFEQRAVDGEPLTISLDRDLQTRAEELLERQSSDSASAIVAIKPSTGEILAAANGPANEGQNLALNGRYAPGSTFKVVTSLSLVRAGIKPNDQLDCPRTVTVDGRTFSNHSGYPSSQTGSITLADAIAHSCNTAMITSRSEGDLIEASAAFGIDVPESESKTSAAANTIGQGQVLATPLQMANVAASVAADATVYPRLVPSAKSTTETVADPLTQAEAAMLRELMAGVVERGTGTILRGLAEGAKTGTAEFGAESPPQTHAWMIAFSGDLAVAVFVAEGDSGSATAGPILAEFLR